MTPRLAPRSLLLAAALLATLPTLHAMPIDAAAPATTLNFMGTPYLHRWSKAGQNEYTPLAQSDLARWRDMVTIQVYDHVATADQLANVANSVLAGYQNAGLIVRANSLPATPGHPAQHMIVALLSGQGLREMVFTRFVLTPEGGAAIVYSHRVYGATPDAQASAWFKANDLALEKAVMAWTDLPSLSALRALPQTP